MPPQYDYKFLAKPTTAAIVGCPFSGGQGRAGVDLGPVALVQGGLISQLTNLGWEVAFDGHSQFADIPYNPIPSGSPDAPKKDLPGASVTYEPSSARPTLAHVAHDVEMVQKLPDPPIGNMKKPRLVSAVCERVRDKVKEHAEKGSLPLTLGGDHSLAMGTVSGTMAKYPDACLLWIDAHADINTPDSSESGNLHGCPVSFLLGLEGTDVEPFNKWLKPCLKPEQIVYIGLRDIDPPERRILRENKIKCFSMHDVDRHGIGKVVEMALDYANPNRDRPIHLSFDVDACDPAVAGSTGTPVLGGLTFREGHYICEAIAETGCLVALDIMEVNPTLGDERSVVETVAIGCSLARAALGETLL